MQTYLTFVATVLTIIYFTVWLIIALKKGETIWQSFKGEDRILQTSEFVTLVGVVGYIFMIPADAFWAIEASEKLWYGIDIIVLGSISASTIIKVKELSRNESNKKI